MSSRIQLLVISVAIASLLLLSACSDSEEETTDQAIPTTASSTQTDEPPAPIPPTPEEVIDAPIAVVSTRSLRVRSEPSPEGKVIWAVKNNQIYSVLGLSADGKYIELEIDDAPGGKGWVDANYVTLQGDITNIERGAVALPSPTPKTDEATEESDKEEPSREDALEEQLKIDGRTAIVKTEGQRLRVRKEPLPDGQIVGRVDDGERIMIIEMSDDGEWALIASSGKGTDNAEGGWVAVEFLEIEE